MKSFYLPPPRISDGHGDTWVKQDPKLAIPKDRWYPVTIEDKGALDLICKNHEGRAFGVGPNTMACVMRDANMDGQPYLKLFYPPNPPQWLIDHEERHGNGWQHE